MEIQVTAKPNILLETVELLYAYVNNIPPRALSVQGDYCLPVEAVREIMDAVCAGISRTDSLVSYYFGRHPLLEMPGQYTCMARNLVYSNPFLSEGNIGDDYQRIRDYRRIQIRNGIRFDGINEYSLSLNSAEDSQYVPLAKDLFRLNVEPEYAQMLLEQFANFDDALPRLATIVTPAAERLAPLLEKWAVRAEPLADAWREYLKKPESLPLLLKRAGYQENPENIGAFRVQIRYLQPSCRIGVVSARNREIFYHMGAAIPVEQGEANTFENWEFEALRLMSNKIRMQMLRLMLDKPLSARELTRILDLHLGSVCRDISSMHFNHLLTIQVVNGRKKYRTNMETIQILTKHMLQLHEFDII